VYHRRGLQHRHVGTGEIEYLVGPIIRVAVVQTAREIRRIKQGRDGSSTRERNGSRGPTTGKRPPRSQGVRNWRVCSSPTAEVVCPRCTDVDARRSPVREAREEIGRASWRARVSAW